MTKKKYIRAHRIYEYTNINTIWNTRESERGVQYRQLWQLRIPVSFHNCPQSPSSGVPLAYCKDYYQPPQHSYPAANKLFTNYY